MAKLENSFSQIALDIAKSNASLEQAMNDNANVAKQGFNTIGKGISASGEGLKFALGKLPGAKVYQKLFRTEGQKQAKELKQANKALAKNLGIPQKKLLKLQKAANLKEQRAKFNKDLIESVEKMGLEAGDLGKNANKDLKLAMDKDSKKGPSGAKAAEIAGEARDQADDTLSEQQTQTGLLRQLVGLSEAAESGEKKKGGGFLSSLASLGKTIMTAVAGLGASLLAATGLPVLKKLIFGGPKKGVPTVGRGPGGRFTALPKKKTGLARVAGAALKGLKFLPVVGLAVTAISGLWDGFTAGMKEAENENSTGMSIAREATAGVLSGLTFGLVDQETISSGMTNIATSIGGLSDSVGAKLTELGVTQTFQSAKDSVLAFGSSMSTKIASIEIPTFAEASASVLNFGTGLATAIGLPIPTFDEAKASLTAMGNSLTAGFTSIFGEEDGSFSFASVSKGVAGLAGAYFGKIKDIWKSITDLFPTWEKIKEMLPSVGKITNILSGGWFGGDDAEVKFDPKNFVSRSDVKTLVATAVTKALNEQAMMNKTSAAAAPFMFMQGAQNRTSITTINKPLAMPVVIKEDNMFNPMNWF